MNVNFSLEHFLRLLEVPTTADYHAVFDSLRKLTPEPIHWEWPGDDAEYITELQIGGIEDNRKVIVCFSKYGNLCYAYVPSDPLIGLSRLEVILNTCGWVLVLPEEANIVLFEKTKATVFHCFFSYV